MVIAVATTALVLLVYILYCNVYRTKRLSVNLTPNCLLTRSPLVFVSGKRNIFYFLNFWNSIPSHLKKHGYEVIELNLDWRDSKKRVFQFKSFLDQLPGQAHFFIDPSSRDLLDALSASPQKTQSLTCVNFKGSTPTEVANYSLDVTFESRLRSQFFIWQQLFALSTQMTAVPRLPLAALGCPFFANTENIHQHYLKHAIGLAESEL